LRAGVVAVYCSGVDAVAGGNDAAGNRLELFDRDQRAPSLIPLIGVVSSG
jgi:hypothetical protein